MRERNAEREANKKEAMNKVLFETKGDFRTEWARKRDEKNAAESARS